MVNYVADFEIGFENRFSIFSKIEIRNLIKTDFRFGQLSIIDFQKLMAFIFEKLDVYKKAIDFAGKICGLAKDFAKGNYYLADQLNRASLSISANVVPGRPSPAGRIIPF